MISIFCYESSTRKIVATCHRNWEPEVILTEHGQTRKLPTVGYDDSSQFVPRQIFLKKSIFKEERWDHPLCNTNQLKSLWSNSQTEEFAIHKKKNVLCHLPESQQGIAKEGGFSKDDHRERIRFSAYYTNIQQEISSNIHSPPDSKDQTRMRVWGFRLTHQDQYSMEPDVRKWLPLLRCNSFRSALFRYCVFEYLLPENEEIIAERFSTTTHRW